MMDYSRQVQSKDIRRALWDVSDVYKQIESTTCDRLEEWEHLIDRILTPDPGCPTDYTPIELLAELSTEIAALLKVWR
tara:strand:+ start:271 stop:504 length:234 start_codon:yes stop_codon:yes gene_type:complete